MKQLKFMLAAATAIGLAAAAQADGVKETKLIDNENFDAIAVDTAATAIDGYSYAGATAADNESVVKAGGYDSSANALQVNTGTDPLLRALDAAGDAATPVTLTAEKSVYIDTMVQFTVTPHGDTVTPGEDDKLMIYLKEDLSDAEAPVTNLIVRAAAYSEGFVDGGREYVMNNPDPVEPNTWYRLVVKAKVISLGSGYWPVFEVYLGGDTEEFQLSANNESGIDNINEDYDFTANFVSLQIQSEDGEAAGADTLSLQYVGFAGEGLVDNLTVATLEPQTSVDFTFTWTTARISAVTYTIGNGAVVKDQPVTSGTAIADLDPGATITIAVTPADWYALVDDPVLSYQVPTTAGQSANLDDLVKKLANVTEDGVVIESTTTPAALNIMTGSFASEAAGSAELAKAVKWATSKGGASASTVGATVGALNFADEEETQAEKAYLLNVADDAGAVAAAIAAFKFPAFEAGKVPSVFKPADGYNVEPKIFGAETLEALKTSTTPATTAHKFFKAVLSK